MRSLTNKSLLWFMGCTVAILLICTPLFYYLTKQYYAEEMVEMVKRRKQAKERQSNSGTIQMQQAAQSTRYGKETPHPDLGEDIMTGVMIQFALIVIVLSVASVVSMRFVSKRLWAPFYDTMNKMSHFHLDKGDLPPFTDSDVKEFTALNHSLTELMTRNRKTFKSQQEFTQNASHELQTPLAVIKSKLDLLLQEDLNERQLQIVQEMYAASNRMAHLNRSLLLLAKIDNDQYKTDETVNMNKLLTDTIAVCENLYNRTNIAIDIRDHCLIRANGNLLEILVTNLIVNAVRNTTAEGRITVRCSDSCLEIANTATGGALDTQHLFERFNHVSEMNRGNGIGLSIVKAICNYHGWSVRYAYAEGMHRFSVRFVSDLSNGEV